jgi:hypothetical protein
VWNQATHHWGEPTAANNYSWDGPAKPPGTSWSVDNPVNNYYYSFLRATMLWGLVSKHEAGRAKADTWLQKFRNEKIENQLVPVFQAQLQGGGSREGTGYGTAMRGLFFLYHLWEKTTGERIADRTPHTQATMAYMLHAIAPTRDRLAPIGDHARDETAELYDYHRDMLLALSSLFRGTALARTVRDFLAGSSRTRMGDRFNWVFDVLYDSTEVAAPQRPAGTYLGSGTGHLFARSSWDTSATWLTFLTGAYTESHAHSDGLSLMLYKRGWLVNDANMSTHSGLAQTQLAHGLVTQRRVSDNVLLPMYAYSAQASPARPESSARLRALATRPHYTHASSDSGTLFVHPGNGDQGVRQSREVVFVKPDTVVVFDRVQYLPGATVKTFQLPVPGLPSISGRIASYSHGTAGLQVFAVAPASSTLSATDMRTVDPDFEGGYRIDARVTSSGLTNFLHVLSVDGAVLSATRGANDGAVDLLMADGRRVALAFDPAGQGGTIEIRDIGNRVVASEPLSGSVATLPAEASADPARLANISTRMQVRTGDDVMIGGFIIGGADPKTVVVRARGPSLAAQGVPGVLADPRLQLVRSSDGATLGTNDDWGGATNAAAIQASGFAPLDPREPAILATLAPGAYTAIVSGAGSTTGVGIAEVFEVDARTVPLLNISTRGRVMTGSDVMIGGFIIQGDGPQTVVLRARGPSLTAQGVPGALANPMLQLFEGAQQLAVNDDWQDGPGAAAILAAGFHPSDSRESAILATLEPGAYTVIVTGVGGTTGVGIVEVFRVP